MYEYQSTVQLLKYYVFNEELFICNNCYVCCCFTFVLRPVFFYILLFVFVFRYFYTVVMIK